MPPVNFGVLERLLEPDATAAAPMPAPVPTMSSGLSSLGDQDLARMMPDVAPAAPPGGGEDGRGRGFGSIFRMLAPVLGSLAAGRGGPRQTGFMQGFSRGQQLAQQEREKRQLADQDRKTKAAKFRMEIFEQARQITDPREWSQFIDNATQAALEMGLITDPAEFKQHLTYPSHLEASRRRKSAIERLESLVKAGYDLDELAEQNATVLLEGQPYKVRDLATIAGSLPEVGGKPVGPPKKPGPTGTEKERAATLLGKIRTAKASGNTAEAARLQGEYDDLIRATKEIGQADDRPRVTVDVNTLKPGQEFTITERLAKVWSDATKATREMTRQHALMTTGLKRFRQGDKNGGSQAVLVTFQKILDPTSVVRESEYARTASGQSALNRIEGYVEKLAKGGAGMTDGELAAMVETARQFLSEMQSHSAGQRRRIEAQVKKYKLDPATVFDDVLLGSETPAGAPRRLKFNPATGKVE